MDEINQLYRNRGYMDRYGIHVWISLITCVVFLLAIGYYYVNNHMKSLQSDWDELRCNPVAMPFAGMIHQEEGLSAAEYTQQNFTRCLNETMRPMTKTSLKPLKQISSTLVSDLRSAAEATANINIEMDEQEEEVEETEDSFTAGLKEQVNSSYILLNKFKDLLSKMNGVTYLLTYQMQGLTYMTMSIANKLIKILTKNALTKSIVKCFAKGTPIRYADGSSRAIEHVASGDVLWDGSIVTSTMILSSDSVTFYEVGGVQVTHNHNVFHPVGGWIQADKHPDSTLVTETYPHEHIYCFNTTSKTIRIGKYVFSDWDDLDDNDLQKIQRYFPQVKRTNIHTMFDDGYPETTAIRLETGEIIQMGLLQPGDTLSEGETVYGIVKVGRRNYHLLTNTGTFRVYQHSPKATTLRGDYNTLIEKYL